MHVGIVADAPVLRSPVGLPGGDEVEHVRTLVRRAVLADVPHRGVGIVGRIGDVGGGIRAGTPVIAAARGEQEYRYK